MSGGEDGARYGPSLMPGGSDKAWYVVIITLQVDDLSLLTLQLHIL